MDEATEFYLKDMPEVEYRQSKYSVLNGCDTLVLLTEWLVGTSSLLDYATLAARQWVLPEGRSPEERSQQPGKEFRSPDFEEIKKRLKKAVIFDGRN